MKLVKFLAFLTACIGLNPAPAQERIVSIGGDVTEIIYALGAEQALVGRDSTSIAPLAAQQLPDVGYMRQLNVEGILALKPTKVISSDVARPSVVFEQLKSLWGDGRTRPFRIYTGKRDTKNPTSWKIS
ncbi:ABC transporter substrate-binding protein [Actinobacillus equuli subsp. haemolyticus]|nr:ABC transporter substrate-binding protein [Actinobacillus equuli subsp. haemolyticus]